MTIISVKCCVIAEYIDVLVIAYRISCAVVPYLWRAGLDNSATKAGEKYTLVPL